MITVKVGQRGVVTLPKKMRMALGIAEGGVLGVSEKNGALLLEPQLRGDNPVLTAIHKGLEEIRRGEFIEFGSITELHKKAKRYAD